MQCYPTMQKEQLTLGADQDVTICRTGSLAEGWSSAQLRQELQFSFCPPALPLACASCSPFQLDTGALPFLPLHHLLTFIKETLFLSFFSLPFRKRARRRLGTVLCSHKFLVISWPNWQLAVVEKAQSYTQAKPHCQVNFIYKHTKSWMTVLKAPGPRAPKTDQHLFDQYYNNNCCKYHWCFSPFPLRENTAECELPVAKFCMIWYPPTPDKFGCAVSRAPGPAQFYCHSAQLTWFSEDHDLIPAREGDYLLQMGGGILYKYSSLNTGFADQQIRTSLRVIDVLA